MLNVDSVALDLIVGELYPVKGYASGSMTSMFISIYLHIFILIYLHFVSTLLYVSAVDCRPATTVFTGLLFVVLACSQRVRFKFVFGQICLYCGLWGGSLVRSSLFLLRSLGGSLVPMGVV